LTCAAPCVPPDLAQRLAGRGQFCIDNPLAAAPRGEVAKGLFFRGAGTLPFGDRIRSVRELIERLLTPADTAAQPVAA